MDITIIQQGSTAVATLTGDITHAVAEDLEKKLLDALVSADALVLDFGGIRLLTSAGLRILLRLYHEARQNHKKLLLAAVPEAVRGVMASTGFLKQYVTCESVNDAFAEITKTAKP